jgi:hypothetical protein
MERKGQICVDSVSSLRPSRGTFTTILADASLPSKHTMGLKPRVGLRIAPSGRTQNSVNHNEDTEINSTIRNQRFPPVAKMR